MTFCLYFVFIDHKTQIRILFEMYDYVGEVNQNNKPTGYGEAVSKQGSKI